MQTRSTAARALRFSELSIPRQRLVRICQMLSYGSVRKLAIKRGEPAFEPPPLLAVDLKVDQVCPVRTEAELQDFVLRDEVLCLMAHFDRLVTTTVDLLEVHAGIPRRAIFILPTDGRPAFLALKGEQS